MKQKEEQSFSSGQLAAEAGVSADTLRHYERMGVLAETERSPNGYRRYPPSALQRVRLIRGALTVGFTLEELAGILRQRDAGNAPCRRVHAMAVDKLAEIDRRIIELISLRDAMRSMLEGWGSELASTPEGQPAHLLEKWTAQIASDRPVLDVGARRTGAAPFSIRQTKEKS